MPGGRYCCVYGCGRNNKTHKHMTFYKMPNEKQRRVQWLQLSGREDLVKSDKGVHSLICSRHFNPKDILPKKKTLKPDAKPELHLPGSWDKVKSDDEFSLIHEDVVCNACEQPIVGFRYKCITCKDYDLCLTCELNDTHPNHFMLRIPKPAPFKLIDKIMQQSKGVLKTRGSEIGENVSDSSDDDVPINQYAKNYDSGVDLTEDVKDIIREEVKRVVNLKPEELEKNSKNNKKDDNKKRCLVNSDSGLDSSNNKQIPDKRLKLELDRENNSNVCSNNAPEVVFADVNEDVDLKHERNEFSDNNITAQGILNASSSTLEASLSGLIQAGSGQAVQHVEPPSFPEVPVSSDLQPVMHVKLSDDLTQLMIEVTANNQKTFYKYPNESN